MKRTTPRGEGSITCTPGTENTGAPLQKPARSSHACHEADTPLHAVRLWLKFTGAHARAEEIAAAPVLIRWCIYRCPGPGSGLEQLLCVFLLYGVQAFELRVIVTYILTR